MTMTNSEMILVLNDDMQAHAIAINDASGMAHMSVNDIMLGGDSRMSDCSSEGSTFDDADLLQSTVGDDITAQLAAAGPVGMAAAAAVATGRLRKRPYHFETNPSVRKRQQTRLLRKLRMTIDEYTIKVGQQAVVVCCTPAKASNSLTQVYKCFGSQPLENVMKGCQSTIMSELEQALAQTSTASANFRNGNTAAGLYPLPAITVEGIPTPVDLMTQAQLRAFIPEMLKHSTLRSKPGWGKPQYRPAWWPQDVPWANVRSDVRTDDRKQQDSWTYALRRVVKNCYKYHGREDLLPQFSSSSSTMHFGSSSPSQFHLGRYTLAGGGDGPSGLGHTIVQAINNPDGTISVVEIETSEMMGAMTGDQHQQFVQLLDGTQAQIIHEISQSNETSNSNSLGNSSVDESQNGASGLGLGNQSVIMELVRDVGLSPMSSIVTEEATGMTLVQDANGQFILTTDANSNNLIAT